MINQIHITEDLLNLKESDFYSGCIKPSLHEDVVVVYINPSLRKLFKYKRGEIRITRPRGIQFALRYIYDGRNASNAMRRDISIAILNSVIGVIENKLKDII